MEILESVFYTGLFTVVFNYDYLKALVSSRG